MPIAQKFPVRIIAYTVLIAVAVFTISIASAVALEYRKEYPPKAANLASVLLVLSPNVFLTPAGDAEQPVEGKIEINSGSAVRTSGTGSAVLVYPNGTITTLEGDTSVVVEELDSTGSRSKVALLAGTMWSRIDRLLDEGDYYEVRSHGIVSSVRGTSFEMSADDTGVSVTVLSDIVSIAKDPQVATTTDNFADSSVFAGERLRVSVDRSGLLTSASEVVQEQELVQQIQKQEAVQQTIQTSEVLLDIQNLPLPEAGVNAGSIFYPLERLTETLAALAETDPDAKAQRLLGQAAERLAEAQVAENRAPIGEILNTYEDLVSMALLENSESKTTETRSIVANATRAHLDVLKSILSDIPEEERAFVKRTIAISEQGHIEAIDTLAESDAKKGFDEGIRAQKHFLDEAQKSAVNGNSVDTYESLRLYDRVVQTLNTVSEGNPDLLEKHSESLTRSLRTIETLESVEDRLLPGMSVTVNDARERSINSQLATIADMVLVDAPRAALAFDKAAQEFAKDVEKDAKDVEKKAEKEPRKSLDKKGESYKAYENFGAEMAFVAKGLRSGTTTVSELVEKANEQHISILENVATQVTPPAKEQVRQVLEEIKTERPKEEDPPKTPQQFAEQKKSERPVGDLPQPQIIESAKRPETMICG